MNLLPLDEQGLMIGATRTFAGTTRLDIGNPRASQ